MLVERLYMIGESIYGDVAERMFANGWASFPQMRYVRMPARIDGRTIKIGAYFYTGPSKAETSRWAVQAAGANAAIILGEPSGNTFALDVDINDEFKVITLKRLAAEFLGETPFKRWGAVPRVALIYRVETAAELPRGRKIYLAGDDGAPSEDMIEILGHGRALTAFGHHHRTGLYFKWNMRPTHANVEEVPVVTPDQIRDFLAAVDAEMPFVHAATARHVDFASGDIDGVKVAKVRNVDGKWIEENGLVSDGREVFLWSLCRETVRRNPKLARAERGLSAIRAALSREFLARSVDDGKWDAVKLDEAIREKVARAAGMLADGALKTWSDRPTRAVEPVTPVFAPADTTFSWIRARRADLDVVFSLAKSEAAFERRLRTDRDHAERIVKAGNSTAIASFMDDVYGKRPRVHLLRAPTGASKTTMTIDAIVDDPRTFQYDTRPLDQRPGPYVFLLPTYANIAEVRAKAELLNLDPSLSDEKLVAAAEEIGIYSEGEIETHLADLRKKARRAGLHTMVYRGKVAAGCKRADEVELLEEAGLGTAGLCRSQIQHPSGMVEDRQCEHYLTCPAIIQRSTIESAHLVFLPRNFLDLEIPTELKKVRGVIADESIFSLLVHKTIFPLSALDPDRDSPHLSGDEIEAGLVEGELLESRRVAVNTVKRAFAAGRCPAEALSEIRIVDGDREVTGLQLAKRAKRVLSHSITQGARVHPHLRLVDLEGIVAAPKSEHAKSEHRFWKVIVERIEMLAAGKATGAKEMSLQLLGNATEQQQIRVSWLSDANWSKAPMLLLDASGDPEITGRVFPGREIVAHDVTVDLNIRTLAVIDRRFAVRNILPGPEANAEAKFQAARLLHEIRCVISTIASAHANGCVLVGMPKKVRKAVQYQWLAPQNVDFLHSGIEPGLDFARKHVAVVSIGRLELPTSEIDAQVAALTYRDATPEMPIDANGTGTDNDGKTVYPHVTERTLKLRDGRDAGYQTQVHAGSMARRVQKQHREERIRQLIGRVRPVFRGDTPAVYIIGQAVPDDLIIDELCAWDDLVQSGGRMWDVVRKAGGIINARLMLAADQDTASEPEYQAWIDALPGSVLAHYSRAEITITGRESSAIYVPGFIEQIAEWVIDVCRAFRLRGQYHGTALTRSTKRVDAAPDTRPEDKIEAALGDLNRRRLQERLALRAVRNRVMRAGKWRPGAGVYRAGTGELALLSAPLGAWAALDMLEDAKALAWIGDDREEAPGEGELIRASRSQR